MPNPREMLRVATGFRGASDLLRQRSLRDGLWGGNRNWLAVGALVWGVRGLRKAMQRNDELVMRKVIPPGATIKITEDITRPTRRQRKRLASPRS